MVNLRYLSGSQADLVAVGAIAGSSTQSNLLLRQLALQCFTDWTARISSTGYTHSLIYIGAAGQWVTDSTTQTGSSTTERLDFRRMVMSLVLEHNQPFLILAVDISIYYYTAGIDFLGLVQILQLALLSQCLHANNSQIHQGNIPVLASIELLAVSQVLIIGLLDRLRIIAILNIYQIHSSGKGSMAAVIRPVGINNPDFSNGRLTLFGITEVGLAELQILKAHGKAPAVHKLMEGSLVHGGKATKNLYILWHLELHVQGLRLLHGGLTALYCIDVVGFDLLQGSGIHITNQHYYTGSGNLRTLLLGNQLYALGSRISSLIILARQVFHSKHGRIWEAWQLLLVDNIHRWLREYNSLYLGVLLIAEALDIITVEQADSLQPGQAEALYQIVMKLLGWNIKEALSLFYKNSSYTH